LDGVANEADVAQSNLSCCGALGWHQGHEGPPKPPFSLWIFAILPSAFLESGDDLFLGKIVICSRESPESHRPTWLNEVALVTWPILDEERQSLLETLVQFIDRTISAASKLSFFW